MQRIKKNTTITVQPIRLTEEAYFQFSEGYGGFCVACGDEAQPVEPDARNYRCESCGEHSVFGAEELLIRGIIRLTGDKGEV